VHDLILADWISRSHTAGLTVRSLFKSSAHSYISSEAERPDQVLASDDMLALLSMTAPGNAVADFLVKWRPLQLSTLSLPVAYFAIAVQEISQFKKDNPE
jgi:hypothetical protein